MIDLAKLTSIDELKKVIHRFDRRLKAITTQLFTIEPKSTVQENVDWQENRHALGHVFNHRSGSLQSLAEFWLGLASFLPTNINRILDVHSKIPGTEDFYIQFPFTRVGWGEIQLAVYRLSNFEFLNKGTIDLEFMPFQFGPHWPDGFPNTNEEFKLTQWPDPEISRDIFEKSLPTIVGHVNPPKFRRRFPRIIRTLDDKHQNTPFPTEEGSKARLVLDPGKGTDAEKKLDGSVFKLINDEWELITDELSPIPDILEAYGLRVEDDYFGPWIIEDINKALDLLITTFRSPFANATVETITAQESNNSFGIALRHWSAEDLHLSDWTILSPPGPGGEYDDLNTPAWADTIHTILKNAQIKKLGVIGTYSRVGRTASGGPLGKAEFIAGGVGKIVYREHFKIPEIPIKEAQYYFKTDIFGRGTGDVGDFRLEEQEDGSESRVAQWTPWPTLITDNTIESSILGELGSWTEPPIPFQQGYEYPPGYFQGRNDATGTTIWGIFDYWWISDTILLIDWDFASGDTL